MISKILVKVNKYIKVYIFVTTYCLKICIDGHIIQL